MLTKGRSVGMNPLSRKGCVSTINLCLVLIAFMHGFTISYIVRVFGSPQCPIQAYIERVYSVHLCSF